MINSGKELDYAYGHESHANVRERILLLRRVRIDNQEAASVAELELHRSRGWAYKWLKRYNNEGILGLKDKPRSGRHHYYYCTGREVVRGKKGIV